jgi:hypothetical protein
MTPKLLPPTRRDFTVSAVSVMALAACPTAPTGDDDTTGDDDDTSGDDDTSTNEWASGGTAGMAETYPDPFEGDTTSCVQTCAMTLGPCYGESPVRRDVSEGETGLPVRLAFLIVDADCNPVDGADVDIWHTASNGIYSGENVAEMCTLGDPEAEAGQLVPRHADDGRGWSCRLQYVFPGLVLRSGDPHPLPGEARR